MQSCSVGVGSCPGPGSSSCQLRCSSKAALSAQLQLLLAEQADEPDHD